MILGESPDLPRSRRGGGETEGSQTVVALIEQARQTVEEIGDPREELDLTAAHVMSAGDVEKATALVEQGRQAAEEISDPRHKAERLKGIAGLKGMVGAWTAAAAMLDEGRQVAEEIGDPRAKAWALRDLAEAAGRMQNPEKAAALIEQGRQAAEGIGDRWDKARTLVSLAEVTGRSAIPRRPRHSKSRPGRWRAILGTPPGPCPVPEDLTWLLRDRDLVESFARSRRSAPGAPKGQRVSHG